MNILITGGAGFIGSHLAKNLISDERVSSIKILDCYKKGKHNLVEDNSGKICYVNQDLTADNLNFDQLLDGVDYIYHLAAEKYSGSSDDNYQKIIDTNITATYKLFEEAAKRKVKRIIFSSSLYVYGDYYEEKYETSPLNPHTIYGISKIGGEQLLRKVSKEYDMNYNILRFFFVYGPGVNNFSSDFSMGYKSVILKHLDRIGNNQPPEIYGSGEQKLDYIYIDDLIEALKTSLFSDTKNETFNIGSATGYSVNDITQKILKLTSSKLNPIYKKADATDKTIRVANIDKAKEKLGFEPKTKLEKGLENIMNWIS
jgi:UDP-glucose 4-epimerase